MHLYIAVSENPLGRGEASTYLRGICLSLDDIENADVAACFTWRGRHHAVLWLQ